MFEYRIVQDAHEVLPIAQSAFMIRYPDRPSVPEWLEHVRSHGSELYGVYAHETLLSLYMLHNYRMRYRSSVLPMGGIGLLCSRLDTRGKGAVRFMIGKALETMRDRGLPICVLDPFSETFYRKYGWELFERTRVVECSPGLIDVPDDADQGFEIADQAMPDEAAKAYYNSYASRHYTLVQRGESEWVNRTVLRAWYPNAAARGAVKFARNGEVVGLLGYNLVRKQDEDQGAYEVNLMACEDETVRRAMLRFIGRLSHQISKVRIDLPIDQDLWPYLSNPPDKHEVRDGFMIRIVELEQLNGLTLDAPDSELCIDVADNQAPWNAGVWRIGVKNGSLMIKKGTSPELRCGIGVLSSVLSGFATFREMVAVGKAEALESYAGADFPKAPTFLADYF